MVTAAVVIVCAMFLGWAVAGSAAIGAVACLTGNGLFAFWVFTRYSAAQPGELLLRFYGAEVVKLLWMLTMFIVAFLIFDDWLNPPALFGAFFIVQTLPALLATRSGTGITT